MKKANVFSLFSRVKYISFAVAACTFALALADVAMKTFSGNVIDAISEGNIQNIRWILIGITGVSLVVLKFLHPYLCRLAVGRLQASLYDSFGEVSVEGKQYELEKVSVGQATTNFTSDVGGVTACIERLCKMGIYDVFLFAFTVFVLFRSNIWLGITAVCASVVPVVVMFFISKLLVFQNQNYQQTLQKINEKLGGDLGSIEFIKANGLEEYVLSRNKIALNMLVRAKCRLSFFEAVVALPMLLCPFITVFSVAGLGGYLVLKGELGIGQLFAAITLADNIVSPVMRFDNTIRRVRRGNACLTRINKVLTIGKENSVPAVEFIESGDKRILTVRDLSFSYPNGKVVYKGLSFEFSSGGINVLAGDNGSGKSTFIKLISGVYEPLHGRICLEGISPFKTKSELRNNIVIDCQQPLFFGGTLRDIISQGKVYSDEEILSLCRDVGLFEDISALPCGLDTVLEADGGFLSGGQKRRLAIVSALIRRSEIYVFDEPTAGVDNDNSALIFKMLEALAQNALVIVITHDPKLISKAKSVVRLEAKK